MCIIFAVNLGSGNAEGKMKMGHNLMHPGLVVKFFSFYLSLRGFASPHYRTVGAHSRQQCYIEGVFGAPGCVETSWGSPRCPVVTCFQGRG